MPPLIPTTPPLRRTELFAREDSVEAAWNVVGNVLEHQVPVQVYEPGSWGLSTAVPAIIPPGGWYDPMIP
jgi:glucose-6-phosphate 1-dehydrogenase